MADNSFNRFLGILRDRDVPYNRDTIKSAFDAPENQTAIQAWMQEFLSPETLLTKEEATLYAALKKSGEADKIAAAHDLSVLRGLDDEEIHNAIEELKRSTEVIEKQTEALQLQQNALDSLVKNNARAIQVRSRAEQHQQRKWDVEKGHLSTAVEELSQSLKYQTADLEQQAKALESGAKQTIESILRSDDKLLCSLQKLASDLEPQNEDDNGLITHIRELCARLIKHTVESIRTRLSRIYLETLNKSDGIDESEDSQDVIELQEELESLYSEILPVAQMSAEQRFLAPAQREIAARNGQGQERSATAVKYINDCLGFLVNRIETFLERIQEHQHHKLALQYVLKEAKKELSQLEPISPTKTSSNVKSNTQRRRRSSGSKSPVQLRNTRRRSSGNLLEEIEPEQQLLRCLGVSLPAEITTDEARVDLFERALAERLSRLESHTFSLQATTESSISSHLLDAHATLQLLQDSLYAESLYHKVQLLDPDIETSIGMFQNDLQALQEQSEAVKLHKLQERNVNKESLIERWSR